MFLSNYSLLAYSKRIHNSCSLPYLYFSILLLFAMSFLYLWPFLLEPIRFATLKGDVFHNIYTWERNLSNICNGYTPQTTTILFPEMYSGLFAELDLANTFIYSILGLVISDQLFRYGILVFLAYFMTGSVVYAITCLLGEKQFALVAACLAAFISYRFEHIPHVQIIAAQWFLVSLYLFLHFLYRGGSIVLALFLLSQLFLFAGPSYNLLVLLVALPILLFSIVLRLKIAHLRRRLSMTAGATLLAAAVVSPLWYPYFTLFKQGLHRTTQENLAFKLDLTWFLVAPRSNLLYGSSLDGIQHVASANPVSEISLLFPGVLASILFCLTIRVFIPLKIQLRPCGTHVSSPLPSYLMARVFTIIGLIFLFLSLGNPITWNGQAIAQNPLFLLASSTPVLSATRYIAHFGYVAIIFFSIASVLVLGSLVRNRSIFSNSLLSFILASIIFIENFPNPGKYPLPDTTFSPRPPKAYQFLAKLPARSGAVFLPLPTRINSSDPLFGHQFEYMLRASFHRLWMVNGITGFFPQSLFKTMEAFRNFPSIYSFKYARDIGLQFIILDHRAPEFERIHVDRLINYKDTISPIYSDDQYTIFHVEPEGVDRVLTNTFHLPSDRLAYKLLALRGPSTVRASDIATFEIDIMNSGQDPWPEKALSETGGPYGRIFLGVESWIDTHSNQRAKSDKGVTITSRSALPYDIFPGEKVTLQFIVETPKESGVYYLNHGLVIEGIRWIHDTEARPLPVTVES
jgi:hypothetical protein